MKKSIFLLILCCFVLSMHAYEERNLLKNKATKEQVKESLVMNQKWVPYPAYTDRQGWDKFLGANKDYYIKRGESKLHFDWKVVRATSYLEFERSGDRNIMSGPYGQNTQAVADLLMAELAEGKGRFMDDLINGVFRLCEMTSWSSSAHNILQKTGRALPAYDDLVFDLSDGQVGNMLSWIYYFLKDEFAKVDPEISRRLRHELQVKVLDVYLNNDSFWWMARRNIGSMQNNWNPWCNSNALLCFMLLENDKDVLTNAVYESMRSVDEYLNYNHGDGGCDEGPSYWGHAAGKFFDYLDLLNTITGGKINLFDNKLVKDMGEYIYRSYVGNGWVVNFADASAKGGGDAFLIYRYGKAVKSDGMIHFAGVVRKPNTPPEPAVDIFRLFRSLEIVDELATVTPEIITEPFTWYPETQFCYLSNKEGMYLAAKGGNNGESHNHNDVGTFNVYIDQTPVLIDAGVGTYTRQTFSGERYKIWTMQSNYHNLPMINGVPQSTGGKYKSSNVIARKNFFSVDIAKAYPENAKVEKWTRSYQLNGKAIRINDVFSLKETVAPNVVNFLTWGDVQKVSDGKISISVNGVKALFTYDAKAFDYQIETVTLDDPRLSNIWGKQVYRLSFTAKSMVKKGNYSFAIQKVK